MDAGDLIAIYAALVATGSVAWQAWTWWHSRTPRVEVRIRTAILGGAGGTTEEVVMLEAINRSEFRVNVKTVAFVYENEAGEEFAYILLHQLPGSTLPGAIEPHDSGSTWGRIEQMKAKGVPIGTSLRGLVSLATGDEFRSGLLK